MIHQNQISLYSTCVFHFAFILQEKNDQAGQCNTQIKRAHVLSTKRQIRELETNYRSQDIFQQHTHLMKLAYKEKSPTPLGACSYRKMYPAIIIFLFSLLPLTTAQSRNSFTYVFNAYPDCSITCLADAYVLNKCPSDPTGSCSCTNEGFLTDGSSCVSKSCNATEQETVLEYSELRCDINAPFDEETWKSGKKKGGEKSAAGR